MKIFDIAKYMKKKRKTAIKKGLCTMCLKNKVTKEFKTCLTCRDNQQKRYRDVKEKLKRLEEIEKRNI